ncbi:hypothetical protein H2204_010901 [Knufia peltigerae]|uniref:YEATS domain-containing protein n=1 Tax=Knufia peltigerae TaxID=1002370 RepID=A0AA39CSF0_9EURO|nr:hypothetical protein H2204_010901 [Knufia peltigerae]
MLHPTFHNPRIVLRSPPYEIRRLGWGEFLIVANVVLKVGCAWVIPPGIDVRDTGILGRNLTLEWKLDFRDQGSHINFTWKVKKEREAPEVENEEQVEEQEHLENET